MLNHAYRWITALYKNLISKFKDIKGTENVAADHLSRTKNDETSDDSEVDDKFSGETLMEINTKDEPRFADVANYFGSTVKEMTTNFGKLDKFEGHDFRQWQKKMHFLLTTLKVVYVLTTPMPDLLENDTVEAIRQIAKWENIDYICRGHILNGKSNPLFDIYIRTLNLQRSCGILFNLSRWQRMLLVRSSFYLRIEEFLRAQESDKGKGKEVVGPSVNMTKEGGKNKNNKQNKGKKHGFKENNGGSGSNKKPKLEC
ncbi:hypothetical protein Tco_0018407 [Tanacetum coccineum]